MFKNRALISIVVPFFNEGEGVKAFYQALSPILDQVANVDFEVICVDDGSHDDTLKKLIADILSYPGIPARWREPDLEGPHALILPMELNLDGKTARMFSTVTTVATPHDVTLQELHVEVFYPADAETDAALQGYEEHVKDVFGEK